MVRDLIDMERKVWKEDVVKEVFNQRDVDQILKIPISTTGVPDKRIWVGFTTGRFGAKDLLDAQRGNAIVRGQTSGTIGDDGKWKRIWRIKAPMKVKTFFNNAMFQRRVSVDPICSLCGMCPETIDQMLFICYRAIKVWLLSPFRFRPELLSRTELDEQAYKNQTLPPLGFVWIHYITLR